MLYDLYSALESAKYNMHK